MFRRGTYFFHPDANFNFQLNRVVMWNGGDAADIQRAAGKIHDSESWVQCLTELAAQAMRNGHMEQAVGYLRMSEFFLYDDNPEKIRTYQRAAALFNKVYAAYFEQRTVEKFQVPYGKGFLPLMYAKARGETKDRILLHGGNDSYYEEFFFPMLYLAEHGFDVYLFEGPGQGGVLRAQNMKFEPKWEKPVSALLDYFHLDDVTIMGASLGGVLAPRAAAFEKRIRRVVGWSIFPDFLHVILSDHPPMVTKIMEKIFDSPVAPLMNAIYRKAMTKNELIRWNLSHGMYAYGADSPMDYIRKVRQFTLRGIAERIEQDVLIIGAKEDHFIAPRLFHEEYDLLTNARSLAFRLFTNQQDAGGHCNVGNSKLVLDTVADWICEVKGV